MEANLDMKRRLTMALSLVLTTALLTACGSKPNANYKKEEQPAQQQQAAPVTLKIGQIPTIDGLPFWVAEMKEYYKQQGVNVELITFKSAQERDAAVEGGQIDGTLTDMIGAATLYNQGTKVKITSLALGATKEEGPFAILVGPNSDITSPEQLKGVDIAISNNSVIQYVTEKMLLEKGFAAEEIKTTNVAQIPLRFEMLMSGQIKAATMPEPFISLVTAKGGKAILIDTQAKQNYSHSVIIFTDKAIAEKADGIKRFFVAYNLAVLDIKADPQAYRAVLAEKAKLPAEVADTWKVTPSSPAQAPKQADVEAVMEWLVAKKIIAQPIPYEAITNSTLYPQ